MILCLDVGNTQIHGGVFEGEKIRFQFRKSTKSGSSSDEIGVFMRAVLRENGIEPASIEKIALCSVVPDLMHSLGSACIKYFGRQPFVLQAGVRTGLKIRYHNPLEVGPDRIANAVAAAHLYPGKSTILIDYGTATTYDAVSADKEYLGGLILPGLRISMEALESRTARLPSVEITAPPQIIGRTTIESIQSGLFYGNLHAQRGIVKQIQDECFGGNKALVIGTGGFSKLFEKERDFDALIPELVLIGLHLALKMNH